MIFKDYFPLSTFVKPMEGQTLAISLAIYFAVVIAVRIISLILGWIILVGQLISVAATVVGLYCTMGILLSLLIFFEVV